MIKKSELIKYFYLLLVFCLFFAVYYEIGNYLLDCRDYINKTLLFFSEKAILGISGYPPRLENIGFVYPPLIFIFFLIAKNPVLAVAILSSILSTFILYFTKSYKVILLMLSTIGLYISLEEPTYFLLYFMLASLALFLYFYRKTGLSLYIFIAGLIFGSSFYVDFTSITLIPFVLYAIYAQEKLIEKDKLLSMYIVTITPILFFAASWLYLNWVFMKDPLYFLESQYSIFHPKSVDAMLAKGNLELSTKFFLTKALYIIPFSLPYFMGLIKAIKDRFLFYMAPLYIIYISPIVLMFFNIYFGIEVRGFIEAFGLLLFYVIFEYFISRKKSLIINLSFYASIILSIIFMPFSPFYNESTFSRALYGMDIKPNIIYYKDAARFLSGTKGNILADDTDSYPVVYFVNEPKRFVLPYQYEFYTALSSPYNFVDYILVDTSSNADKIYNFYKNGISDFKLVYENQMFKIYERERI